MSLRIVAVKASELKPLDRAGLLLFCARCALRVEPWVPPAAAHAWRGEWSTLVSAAAAPPLPLADVRPRLRPLSDLGALACNELADRDEPLGRAHNYATGTLVRAVEAATCAERPAVVKAAIDTAKLSASIFAVWAHAGRVHATSDPVNEAIEVTWSAIRADIPALAAGAAALLRAERVVDALIELAPLWPTREPPWARPSAPPGGR